MMNTNLQEEKNRRRPKLRERERERERKEKRTLLENDISILILFIINDNLSEDARASTVLLAIVHGK
jgi:hypothetical protein